MRKISCFCTPFMLILFAFHGAGAADTLLRCGNDLIEKGDTMYQVRQVCGEPISAQRVGERTSYTILADERLKIRDVLYMEEWIYKKDSGLYILIFEGGRLVKKEYTR